VKNKKRISKAKKEISKLKELLKKEKNEYEIKKYIRSIKIREKYISKIRKRRLIGVTAAMAVSLGVTLIYTNQTKGKPNELLVSDNKENPKFINKFRVEPRIIDKMRQEEYIRKFEIGSEEEIEEMLIVKNLGDGVLTMGLGHTEPIGGIYQEGDKITIKQVYEFYHQDLKNSYDELEKVEIKLGITNLKSHQRFALASHIYNSGTQNIDGIERYLIEYQNGNEEAMWDNIKDVVFINDRTAFLEGLPIRRTAEHLLFNAKTEEEIIRAYKISKEEIATKYISYYYTKEDYDRYSEIIKNNNKKIEDDEIPKEKEIKGENIDSEFELELFRNKIEGQDTKLGEEIINEERER